MDDIRTVLRAQDLAYRLLRFMDRDAADWLEPESIDMLTHPDTSDAWFERRAGRLPREIVPAPDEHAMVGRLVASMLETSFEIEAVEHEGLSQFELRQRRARAGLGRGGVEGVAAEALRHVLNQRGVELLEEQARDLVHRRPQESLIVAYAWELRQRAKGKSKGPVVHRLWRTIDRETRTTLSEEVVWLARERVETEARCILARPSRWS